VLLPQVLAELSAASLRARLRSLFPCPCRARYTTLTMMPRAPGLLARLAFRWAAASSGTQLAVGATTAAVLLAAAVAVGLSAWHRRRAQR
jgi:hypothetical protein